MTIPGIWTVRLSIDRHDGWRAWPPTAGEFEHALEAQASVAVTASRIDAETSCGRDYLRVAIAISVTAADVTEVLATAWQAFRQAASAIPRTGTS